MNTESKTQPKRRGRPPYQVLWPESNFTAKDVYSVLEGKLSAVSVQLKINKAVEKGQLERVGVKRKVMGRPTIVYRATTTRDKSGNPDPHFDEK